MTKGRSTRIIIYVVLIFLGGLVSGALLAPLVGRTFLRPRAPGEMSRHIFERMQSRLSLTPEQAAEVKPLVETTGQDLDAIRREATARVSERMAQTDEAIAALLTPEQKVELKKMETERKEHMGRHEPFAPPPPPPPPRK
jgi:Spy/CpxP family protein refolding chaperone